MLPTLTLDEAREALERATRLTWTPALIYNLSTTRELGWKCDIGPTSIYVVHKTDGTWLAMSGVGASSSTHATPVGAVLGLQEMLRGRRAELDEVLAAWPKVVG